MLKVWMDMELKQDIDDYITLLFAIETKKNITELSINEPSLNELKLFKYLKDKYKLDIPIIYSGKISNIVKKDIHNSLLLLVKNIELDLNKDIIHLNDYLSNYKDFNNKVIFCGGSFTNFKIIVEKNKDKKILAYLQGGYAGESIVGKENAIDKFQGREQVPSWNHNLDVVATDYILNSKNLELYFISKNICHNSWMNQHDFKNKNSEIYKTLDIYFQTNKYPKKCMHDLVAFASIFNKSFIKFKHVDLFHTNDKLVAWYSILNLNSNKQISISLNMSKFKDYINNNF